MPAGVAVMGDAYDKAERRGSGAGRLLLLTRHSRRSNRADIAEQLLEETALAPEGRGCLAGRLDVHHQLFAGALNRGDIALGIEADNQHRLLGDFRIAEGDLVDVA